MTYLGSIFSNPSIARRQQMEMLVICRDFLTAFILLYSPQYDFALGTWVTVSSTKLLDVVGPKEIDVLVNVA